MKKLFIVPIIILIIIYIFITRNVAVVNTPGDLPTKDVAIGSAFLYGFGEEPSFEMNFIRRENFAEVVLGDKENATVYNGFINYESLSDRNFVYQGTAKNNTSTTTEILTVEIVPVSCRTQSQVEGEFAVKVYLGDKRFTGCANGLKI